MSHLPPCQRTCVDDKEDQGMSAWTRPPPFPRPRPSNPQRPRCTCPCPPATAQEGGFSIQLLIANWAAQSEYRITRAHNKHVVVKSHSYAEGEDSPLPNVAMTRVATWQTTIANGMGTFPKPVSHPSRFAFAPAPKKKEDYISPRTLRIIS